MIVTVLYFLLRLLFFFGGKSYFVTETSYVCFLIKLLN